MLYRVVDKHLIQNSLDRNPRYIADDFDLEDWLEAPRNIAICNNDCDLALFTFVYEGVFEGHYFFNEARGKEAIKLSKEILEFFRKLQNGVFTVVRGLVPLENKAAAWMSRKIGFNSAGIVDTINGQCELFVLPMNLN